MRVNALLPFGSWKRRKRRQVTAGEPADTTTKMCWWSLGEATSVPTQCRSRVLPAGSAALRSLTILLSSVCSMSDRFCVCALIWYVKTLLRVQGFSTSAAGQVLCPRAPPPPGSACGRRRARAFWSRVAGPLRPARSPLGSGQSGPCFLGPPANAPSCRRRQAAWDAEAPRPFGGPRRRRPSGWVGLEGLEARRAAALEPGAQVAHLRGSLCGLIGLKRS